MKITMLAILLMMLAYFLVLYGAVGFIQNKRFFGSAPQEIWLRFRIKRSAFATHMVSAGGLKPSPCCINGKPLFPAVHTVLRWPLFLDDSLSTG